MSRMTARLGSERCSLLCAPGLSTAVAEAIAGDTAAQRIAADHRESDHVKALYQRP